MVKYSNASCSIIQVAVPLNSIPEVLLMHLPGPEHISQIINIAFPLILHSVENIPKY
jgi:hypothetical protein